MKCLKSVSILALLAVFIFSAGVSCAAPDLKSSKPRYASILLPAPHSRSMTVIFDESKGTGKGYDTVYADVNMDGKFSASEKLVSRSQQSDSSSNFSMHSFSAINIPMLTIRGKSKHDISFDSVRFDKEEMFSITIQSIKYANNKPYQYTYYGDLSPSTDKNKPFVWTFGQKASVKLDVKPDGKDTGIAVSLNAGKASIYSQSVSVDLTIKNSAGKVIKKDKGSLDKFAFG